MTVFLPGGERRGAVRAPASKSAAQRLFYCAALGAEPCEIACGPLSEDLEAMLACLAALGASVDVSDGRVRIEPIRLVPARELVLPCGESGAALRFLPPLVGALGAQAVLERRGRLPERPIEPLAEELRRHGMTIAEEGSALRCSGRLHGGDWTLPGGVSSQFISALLLALPLLDGDSALTITGRLESAPYVSLTEQVLPPTLAVEGDWSAAAVFLAMGALSEKGVAVSGLDPASAQGDRAVCELLRAFGAEVSVGSDCVRVCKKDLRGLRFDVSQMPDLAPVAAALGALAEGETRIVNAARLRLKESDRLHTTAAMLASLGADVTELPDALILRGKSSLPGGETRSFSDHRVAMAAAVAACGCEGGLTLRGAECVGKSYPQFWDDCRSLGGI